MLWGKGYKISEVPCSEVHNEWSSAHSRLLWSKAVEGGLCLNVNMPLRGAFDVKRRLLGWGVGGWGMCFDIQKKADFWTHLSSQSSDEIKPEQNIRWRLTKALSTSLTHFFYHLTKVLGEARLLAATADESLFIWPSFMQSLQAYRYSQALLRLSCPWSWH